MAVEKKLEVDKAFVKEDIKSEVVLEEKVDKVETSLKSAKVAIKSDRFVFGIGDTVIVMYKVTEGSKSRIQPYEGVVIGKKGCGVSKTFTVRRMSKGNIGIERIFPMYSPNVEDVKVKSKGKIRRAKLYYLRDRVGKASLKVKSADVS